MRAIDYLNTNESLLAACQQPFVIILCSLAASTDHSYTAHVGDVIFIQQGLGLFIQRIIMMLTSSILVSICLKLSHPVS